MMACGEQIDVMDKELLLGQVVRLILENSKMIVVMDAVKFGTLTNLPTMVSGEMTRKMAKEFLNGMAVQSIKAVFAMTKCMAKGNLHGKVAQSMRVNGAETGNMDRAR